jgi:hypothetical protein
MNTDRNLLFGVLALQADVLDADQFIKVCTLWTTRKQTELADLLIEFGCALVTRTGRRIPVPTRAAYYSTPKLAERAAVNAHRLDAARAHFGQVLVRLVPQVRMCPERPDQYGALQGHAFTLRVDEPADVVALLTDLERFVRSWRSTRTPAAADRQSTVC